MTAVAQISPGRAWRDTTARLHLAAHRTLSRLVLLAIVAFAALAAAPVVAVALGYQPQVVHGGTLSPGVRSGDILFTEVASPADVRAGDVVTIPDPAHPGRSEIVRVLTSVPYGEAVAVTVEDPAGAATKPFALPGGTTVTRVAFKVPP